MNRELTLEQIKGMSSDEIINAYRQGYRLEDMSPATCPTSIIQGTIKSNITIAHTGGTPPYTFKFYVDEVVKVSSIPVANTTWGLEYTFSETVGSHVYKGEVTDSCATGAKVVSDSCTITIVAACATPAITLTIPA